MLVVASGCVVAQLAAPAEASAMVRIPAGPFHMGRDDGPEDERPGHVVELAAYEIDVLPVTNADFARFLQARGPVAPDGRRWYDHDDSDARIHRRDGVWRADPGFEDHPVVEPTWLGARAYCAWLGKRLPTEAEWEKAARGGDRRRYPWGEARPDATRAQFGSAFNATRPVTASTAGTSPHGVRDLVGNAWEWVSSLYRPYPYRADDGREDPEAEGPRGTRGGGHDSPADEITTTQRGRTLSRAPRAGHHNIGFRCAR
jgi:iron(II)-dependent oxidoreductase